MIYVFLANGFEEVEALTPVDMLRRCELEVITVGVGGDSVIGSHNIPVLTNITDSQIVLDDSVDMIVLPGGMPGTLNLEKNANVQRAIDFCVENNMRQSVPFSRVSPLLSTTSLADVSPKIFTRPSSLPVTRPSA